MTGEEMFRIAGPRESAPTPVKADRKWWKGKPVFAAAVLMVIAGGCVFAELIMTKDPTYIDLANYSQAPCREFLFGTDTLGRDIFSMIWYGGRISLFIGIVATVISTAVAVVYGSVSGLAPDWADTLMMRFTEIILSIPGLLLVVLLQAVFGEPSIVSIALVIGLTSWASIAKIVRTEVRQIRSSEYVVAAECMGGSRLYIIRKHLAPNFVSSIMFMVVMNVRSAIVSESTLSFLGIGLPIEIISWGSMLSLSQRAILTQAWWMILIPGAFLIVTLLCMTEIGNALRKNVNKKHSNL